MNVSLVVAGSMALVGAAIHGIAGEVVVVRKLSPEVLPPSPFGGPGMTKAMIQAAWHLTTVAFVTTGCALVAAGAIVQGETARGMAVVGAAAASGFAAVVVVGALAGARRAVFSHPAPILLTAVAVLAWWGVAT